MLVVGLQGPWVPPLSHCLSHSQGNLGFPLARLWKPGPFNFTLCPWLDPKYTRCTNVNLLILLKFF